MKSEKTIIRENTRLAYSLLDQSKAIKTNSLKIHGQNLKPHELMKFHICYQLASEGKDYITEAIFKNGKRADILVPGDMKVIEVLASETIADCEKKVKDYPIEFEVIFVNAKKVFNEKLIY